jgi:uncharacterized membrane protein
MNAAHFHLALNHLPIYAVLFGIALVVIGRVVHSDTTQRVGLWMLVAAGLFAIPVYLTGEPAEEVIEKLPGISEAAIEPHEEMGVFALTGALLLGLLGAATLYFTRGSKPITMTWWLAVVVLGVVSIGVLVQTALLGGKIRHTEIR